MMYKVQHTSSSGSTSWTHTIGFEPEASTYAAAVLLKEHLSLQDADYLKSYAGRQRRIRFSRRVLSYWQFKLGALSCVYCDKGDLVVEHYGMKVSSEVMATVEHMTPVSMGGSVFGLDNIVCACGRCNGNRSNKDQSAYVRAKGLTEREFDKRCQVYFELGGKLA
jgi:5-methylcytosine-specific restriction endonuclease McrA